MLPGLFWWCKIAAMQCQPKQHLFSYFFWFFFKQKLNPLFKNIFILCKRALMQCQQEKSRQGRDAKVLVTLSALATGHDTFLIRAKCEEDICSSSHTHTLPHWPPSPFPLLYTQIHSFWHHIWCAKCMLLLLHFIQPLVIVRTTLLLSSWLVGSCAQVLRQKQTIYGDKHRAAGQRPPYSLG